MTPRPRPIHPLRCCDLAMALLLAATPALAQQPDSLAIARLDALLSVRSDVRVRTDSSAVQLLGPRAAIEGIYSSQVVTTKTTSASAQTGLIPWPKVRAVEELRYRWTWLAGGALAGGILGWTTGNAHPENPASQGLERSSSTPLGLLAGTLAGFALMRHFAEWRVLYP